MIHHNFNELPFIPLGYASSGKSIVYPIFNALLMSVQTLTPALLAGNSYHDLLAPFYYWKSLQVKGLRFSDLSPWIQQAGNTYGLFSNADKTTFSFTHIDSFKRLPVKQKMQMGLLKRLLLTPYQTDISCGTARATLALTAFDSIPVLSSLSPCTLIRSGSLMITLSTLQRMVLQLS